MKTIAFDVETTGLDPYHGAEIFAYSTCDEEGNVEVKRFDGRNGDRNRASLQRLFDDTSIAKVAHNYHFEYSVLLENGFEVPEETRWEDSMIMSQLFDNIAASHALDELCISYCSDTKTVREWMDIDAEIVRARGIYGTYDKIPKPLMDRYQYIDAERCMLLFKMFYPFIKKDRRVFGDYINEIELVKVTTAFERKGVMLCKSEVGKLMGWMEGELKKVEEESFKLLGQYVNLNSPDQVASILFDQLRLPILSRTKTKKPAIDKDALEELRPYAEKRGPEVVAVFDLILRQRSYTKGVAMVSSYRDLAKNEIVHPHINTNRAQTGRESGENPNLQNVSKNAALKVRYPIPARKCFRARPGCVLFLIDYAGIEMRLIIELTKEPELLKLIRDNGDPHALAASLFYGETFNDPDRALAFVRGNDAEFSGDEKTAKKVLRSAAKNSQFALAYGARLPKIAETLMLSKGEAKPGYDKYCERFPLIESFTNRMKQQIESVGYVVTPFGRKLKTNPTKPYSASNYLVQGTAAGILKRAQVRVHRYLEETWGGEVYILLPIHDELIIEMPRKYLKESKLILQDIRHEMIDMEEIKVPLEVEAKMTNYIWSNAKEYEI